VLFGDGETFHIRSGYAAVERRGEAIYLAIPLRNVGSGLAVLQAYDLSRPTRCASSKPASSAATSVSIARSRSSGC
jgi:hypothetical protein